MAELPIVEYLHTNGHNSFARANSCDVGYKLRRSTNRAISGMTFTGGVHRSHGTTRTLREWKRQTLQSSPMWSYHQEWISMLMNINETAIMQDIDRKVTKWDFDYKLSIGSTCEVHIWWAEGEHQSQLSAFRVGLKLSIGVWFITTPRTGGRRISKVGVSAPAVVHRVSGLGSHHVLCHHPDDFLDFLVCFLARRPAGTAWRFSPCFLSTVGIAFLASIPKSWKFYSEYKINKLWTLYSLTAIQKI